MIDFAAMVLAPIMGVLGEPIAFTPAVSQPGAPAYPARGIYAQKQVSVRTEEGEFTDVQPTLGIKVGDFVVQPKRGDSFVLGAVTWFVRDVQTDGQGGADLILAETNPL